MKRPLILAGLLLALVLPLQTLSAVHLSGSQVSVTKAPSSTKQVYVKGYYRKDGTYVAPHYRAAPGSGAGTSPGKAPATSSSGNGCKTCPRDSKGRIIRSEAAKKEFMKETGYPKGRPGYVVDHIIPLECGGADVPGNMQWQTVADAKTKDKMENNCRR